jgi:hypothetical protein
MKKHAFYNASHRYVRWPLGVLKLEGQDLCFHPYILPVSFVGKKVKLSL